MRRAFALRAAGHSYPEIEQGVGPKYSTVRHLLENRAYLGLTHCATDGSPVVTTHSSPKRSSKPHIVDMFPAGDEAPTYSPAGSDVANVGASLRSTPTDATADLAMPTPWQGVPSSRPITALEGLHAEALVTERKSNALVEAFERAAALLRDPAFEFDTIWANANAKERRVLVEELIEAVTIYADRLEVTVTGAPPLVVSLNEVGLRDPGTGPVVSEDRNADPRTGHWRLAG